MRIAALVSLFIIIAASVAAIILTAVRMHKAGKADRRSIIMIALFAFLIIVMVVNLFVVVPNF